MAGHLFGRSNAANIYGYRGTRWIASASQVAPCRASWYPPIMTVLLDDKLIDRIKSALLTCTRTELAARCGVSHATLGRALNGLPVGAPTRRLIELQVSK